jgi:LPS sulfotransferase NodH
MSSGLASGCEWMLKKDKGSLMNQTGAAPIDDAGPNAARRSRLAPFPASLDRKILRDIGPISQQPWPEVKACLIVLFTARSGSTFLTRELEIAFDVGKMGETLNPPKVKKRPLQKAIPKLTGAWFSAKAGVPGVVSGELAGFFDHYIDKTCFIRLMRKDIVAQAVSTAKALQTRAWHAINTPVAEAQYDGAAIADAVVKIERNVDQLRKYAHLTGRPCLPLVYETFANGDLTPAMNVCDSLGAPRHASEEGVVPRPVQRVGDATNEAWIARFTEEMDSDVRDGIARYVAAIEAETGS